MSFLVLIAIFLKNVVYGLSIYFTGSLSKNIDVLDILALRFLLSTVVMFILKQLKVLKINIGIKELFKNNTPHKKELLLTGLFEPVLYMLFETLGISMTTGITAGIILAMSPIFSCIFEWVFLKEKSSLLQKVFLGIGIIGVVYIALNMNTADGKDSFGGIAFMFLAVISGVLFSVFSRKSSKHFKPFEITYITCMEGTVIFNSINIIRHFINGDILHYFDPFLNLENVIGFVYLGVLSTIIATAMNNYAISKAQISSLSAFGGVSTLVTIVAGIILNNETIYIYQIIGITLIFIRMIGVTVIDIKKSRK